MDEALPLLEEALFPVKSARNAVLFGTRIRLADGIVKAMLYHKGDIASAIRQVVDVTFEHGSSLAVQVFLHKVTLIVLRRIQQREYAWHSALGGFIGGSLIWGSMSRFNEMLNLYVFSRVLMAYAKSIQVPAFVSQHAFRAWSAFIWASVMYQFRARHPLQYTMDATMRYLHDDPMKEGWASWGENLGTGARAIPFAAAIVWALKLSGVFSQEPMAKFEKTPSYPEALM